MRPLDAKRVLIVGGVGSGIGRATTEAVAAAGAVGIAVVGRNRERAEETAAAVSTPTCTAVAICADVLKAEDVERVVKTATEALGGIDVLITVIGGHGLYAPWDAFDETLDENWDLIFDINVKYVFRYVRACLKVFLDQGSGGSIVSVGSIAGFTGTPRAVAYGAAKAGLMSMAKTVGAEYGRRGIRMNVVNSGTVLTDAGRKAIGEGVNLDVIPMGRAGRPEDIANVVVFLASPLSGFVTGQSIAADGGVTSRAPHRLPETDSSMAG